MSKHGRASPLALGPFIREDGAEWDGLLLPQAG